MDLNIGTVLTGLVFTLICVLPFVFLYRNRKKREDVFLNELKAMADKEGGTVHKHEVVGTRIIGLDEQKNLLFTYQKSGATERRIFVDLNTTETCELVNHTTTSRDENGERSLINQLLLRFHPMLKSEPAVSIEFFNAKENLQINGEFLAAQRWSVLINSRL